MHPELAWELGPGRRSRHNLTVTPEGNMALRVLTERWVRSAPVTDATWEYYPARQPAPQLQLLMGGHTLTPDDWVIAAQVDDGPLVLNLSAYHPLLRKFPDRERPRVGFVALDQMFGEDTVEKWMGKLNFTTDKPKNGSAPGEVLKMIQTLEEESRKEVFTLGQGLDRDRHPLFLNFNQRLKRLDHLFAETHIQLDLRLRQPNANGLPGPEEGERLNMLEDRLLAAAQGEVYVGRLTGNGRRSMHFYAENPQHLVETLTAEAASSGWQHHLQSERDPEWSFYRERLFAEFAPAS